MAVATVLFLVRHGESAGNVNPRLGRSDDPPLTARGRDQAGRAAAALASVGLDGVYSSPLRRARETAEVVAAAAGLSAQVVEGLGEVDMGALSDATAEEGRTEREAIFSAWLAGDRSRSFPAGETFAAVTRRVAEGLRAIAAAAPGARVAVVTHRMPIAAAAELCRARGVAIPRAACANGSITTLREEAGRLHLVEWCDARHLA